MGRVDKVTAAMRVEAVYRMILDGWAFTQIVRNVSSTWGITVRMAEKYVEKAHARIREEAAKQREQLLAEHLAARRQLRREAKQAKDLRLAADLLRDEAKLLGLYPVERREVDLPPGRAFPVTIVEVATHDGDDDGGEGGDGD